MKVLETVLPGVLIIEPKVFGDARGFFLESYQAERYRQLGIAHTFVQDNHSRSARGVLRGLHFQRSRPQGKLVSVSRGSVYDVAVDINPASPTCGQFVAVELNDENHRQLWIPPGFAHGFVVLSETADFLYKTTAYYAPQHERCILWCDRDLDIRWPGVVNNYLLSEKDRMGMALADAGFFP